MLFPPAGSFVFCRPVQCFSPLGANTAEGGKVVKAKRRVGCRREQPGIWNPKHVARVGCSVKVSFSLPSKGLEERLVSEGVWCHAGGFVLKRASLGRNERGGIKDTQNASPSRLSPIRKKVYSPSLICLCLLSPKMHTVVSETLPFFHSALLWRAYLFIPTPSATVDNTVIPKRHRDLKCLSLAPDLDFQIR